MLRSLVDEVVRRRLWPIPLVAILVAIAAPLVFMKSAPSDAPAADQAPPAPAAKGLPKSARQVTATKDGDVVSRKPSKRKAQDPFAPPAAATKASAAAGASAGTSKASQAIPITIRNADGTTSSATISPSSGSSTGRAKAAGAPTTSSSKPSAAKRATPRKAPAPKPTAPAPRKNTYVDVRFGERMGTMTRYRVPRLQTFRAGGKVAAMFVGYSAKRNAAVFAVAPSTRVSGVTCRKVERACRYVDLPSGAYARLTLRGEDGSAVSRRLDVVSIRRMTPAPPSKASARVTSLTAAKCLLTRLLSLPSTAPSISTDACA